MKKVTTTSGPPWSSMRRMGRSMPCKCRCEYELCLLFDVLNCIINYHETPRRFSECLKRNNAPECNFARLATLTVTFSTMDVKNIEIYDTTPIFFRYGRNLWGERDSIV